jgi:galactokinase
MTIQYGISFAVGRTPGGVFIDSLNEPSELRHGVQSRAAASWHRYALAAIGALCGEPETVGVVFRGDLPATGGLSSSSALVVGLVASLTVDGPAPLSGQALVDAALAAERSAAIEGGAMDQTIIVFGHEGAALRLDFDPPKRRVVPLPEELVLVAANSGECAPKGTSAKDAYNERVVACRCACALLSASLGLDLPDPLVLARLPSIATEQLDALPESLTPEAVAARTNSTLAELVDMTAERFPKDRRVPIRSVARHVFREAAAVDAAEEALRSGDLERFGELLNASHQSLRAFGSSTETLDRLTHAMKVAGALGARVTGAGFGGYAIAACLPEAVDRVLAAAEEATGGPAFVVRASTGIGGGCPP